MKILEMTDSEKDAWLKELGYPRVGVRASDGEPMPHKQQTTQPVPVLEGEGSTAGKFVCEVPDDLVRGRKTITETAAKKNYQRFKEMKTPVLDNGDLQPIRR